jgi:hypothetical protein
MTLDTDTGASAERPDASTRPERPTFLGFVTDADTEAALRAGLADAGLGVLDLARAARTGGRPLASGALGYHVLDTLACIDEAVTSGTTVKVQSSVDDIPLVAADWDPFAATL